MEHRAALVIRSAEGLSAEVSNTDPAYRKEGSLGVALETFENRVATAEPLADTDAARRSADLTNEFVSGATAVLERSEVNARRRREGRLAANLILTRDAGDRVPHPQPIKERFGPEWGCFVEMPVERGISMVLGMAPVEAPLPADPRERYSAWATLAAEALGGHDSLYVHIKGPDVPAHDGRAEDKRDVISAIDEAFFGTILPLLPGRTLIAVTADHATSCVRKAHTADPVPLVVAGPGVQPDGTVVFAERGAAEGRLGRMRGIDIVPALIGLLEG